MDGTTSHERIGEFLVKIGAMTSEQRNEIAVELGYINDTAIDTYLGRKV